MPVHAPTPQHPALRFVRQCLRRYLRSCAACAAALLALGAALPAAAASPAGVVNVILTSRFLEQDRCDKLGLVSIGLLQGLHRGVGVNKHPELTAAQVRQIASRYVDINDQLCNSITPLFAAHDAWARNYGKLARATLTNAGWDAFLADDHAVKWAGIAARFRSELIALNNAIDLVLALRPDAFDPDAKLLRALQPRQRSALRDEIRRVSLTEDEAKLRFLLATAHGQHKLGEMLPERFELGRLAAIEAATRRLGLQFVERYHIDFDELYPPSTRLQLFTAEHPALQPKLDLSVRTATARLKALVSTYR
ncbi:hypothetical protein [Massilia sp. H6]|uniref:hypothetical protein n=1 Tax=Massilia sp. H6 TaxID=2970464 RepID=UPI0021670EDB|nr:hypothetical protein [Massilia sp. H6]UVW29792.1 hypothetical protein NRS07_06620 [Massilia sp. H6]